MSNYGGLLRIESVWKLLLFLVAYIAACATGQSLKLIPGVTITFWPASGIFIAMLLLKPRASWPWIALTACAAELICNELWFDNPYHYAVIYFFGNMCAALTAAWLIQKFNRMPFRLESMYEVATFVICAVIIAPVISATMIATTDMIRGKHEFAVAWWLVWLGDSTGLLVSFPLALIAMQTWRERSLYSLTSIFEAITIGLALVLAGKLTMVGIFPTVYLMLPILLWAAVRFQLRGAAVAIALCTLIAAYGTKTDQGEFSLHNQQLRQPVVMLQMFLGISALSTLLVAALSRQHKNTLEQLQHANEQLELRVAERTAKLHASESRLRLALSADIMGLWDVDLKTQEAVWSDSHFQILGYQTNQTGKIHHDQWKNLIHPDDRDRVLAAVEESRQNRSLFSPEHRILRADNQAVVWLQPYGHFHYDESGQATRFIGVFFDITARKEAEEKIRANEQFLATVFTGIAAAVTVSEVADNASTIRFIDVNQAAVEWSGIPMDQWKGATPHDLFPIDADQVSARLLSVAQTGKPITFEESVNLPTGTMSVYTTASPLFDSAGNVTRIITTSINIGELKRAESQLQEHRRLLFDLVERCPFGIYIVDSDLKIASMNLASQNNAFATVRPIIGRSLSEVVGMIWPEPVADEVIMHFYHTLTTGTPYFSTNFIHSRNDIGEMESYEWELHRILMPEGTYGVVCYYFDSTPLRKAEQALKDADRRKDEFLATLAHELRNPLAPIRNGLQIIKLAGNDPKRLHDAREMMARQVQQMTRLIDDLMDLSRISRGKTRLQFETMDLRDAVRNAVETSRPLIEQQRHELDVHLPDQPLIVLGDSARLAQVFSNLINNAAKYTEKQGRIKITVTRQDNQAHISVQDNGLGISHEQLDRVFDMFAQVDRSLERAQGGLGIGLNIVKRLVEEHRGTVHVESDGLGKGSKFTVCLNVHTNDADATGPPVAKFEPMLQPIRYRILVVDDNPESTQTLADHLKSDGHAIKSAANGHDAMTIAENFQPDVILMDLGMPVLNEFEACQRIRASAWGQNVVIIAQSGHAHDEDKRRAVESGFNFHVTKPVDLAQLNKILRTIKTNQSTRNTIESY